MKNLIKKIKIILPSLALYIATNSIKTDRWFIDNTIRKRGKIKLTEHPDCTKVLEITSFLKNYITQDNFNKEELKRNILLKYDGLLSFIVSRNNRFTEKNNIYETIQTNLECIESLIFQGMPEITEPPKGWLGRLHLDLKYSPNAYNLPLHLRTLSFEQLKELYTEDIFSKILGGKDKKKIKKEYLKKGMLLDWEGNVYDTYFQIIDAHKKEILIPSFIEYAELAALRYEEIINSHQNTATKILEVYIKSKRNLEQTINKLNANYFQDNLSSFESIINSLKNHAKKVNKGKEKIRNLLNKELFDVLKRDCSLKNLTQEDLDLFPSYTETLYKGPRNQVLLISFLNSSFVLKDFEYEQRYRKELENGLFFNKSGISSPKYKQIKKNDKKNVLLMKYLDGVELAYSLINDLNDQIEKLLYYVHNEKEFFVEYDKTGLKSLPASLGDYPINRAKCELKELRTYKKKIFEKIIEELSKVHCVGKEGLETKAITLEERCKQEGYFTDRIEKIFLKQIKEHIKKGKMQQKKWNKLVKKITEDYSIIDKVLQNYDEKYFYKDANPKNWFIAKKSKLKVYAFDFENNILTPPQLDLINLLEFEGNKLTEDEENALINYYIEKLEKGTGRKICKEKFMDVMDFARVQRHLELVGYRAREIDYNEGDAKKEELIRCQRMHYDIAKKSLNRIIKREYIKKEELSKLKSLYKQLKNLNL